MGPYTEQMHVPGAFLVVLMADVMTVYTRDIYLMNTYNAVVLLTFKILTGGCLRVVNRLAHKASHCLTLDFVAKGPD